MRTIQRFVGLCLLAVMLPGCATSTITNLTPSRLPRKDNGLYPLSVEFYSRQETMLRDTLKVYAIVGDQRVPMEQTPFLTNRWETLVPVPASEDVLLYRYRFEYDYKGIPDIRSTSRDSTEYRLIILDR